MVDVKKRTLEDDHEMGIAKKRALSSSTDSPIAVNGKLEANHEDPNEINLEVRSLRLLHMFAFIKNMLCRNFARRLYTEE